MKLQLIESQTGRHGPSHLGPSKDSLDDAFLKVVGE
jgi:hypothetical protein